MRLRSLFPWLLIALALSVAAMVHGAGRGDQLIPGLAATANTAVVILAALWINVPLWLGVPAATGDTGEALKAAVVANIGLAALIYAWGAAALFAVYSLSDVTWRHAWQYGLGAAIIAFGIAVYGRNLERSSGNRVPPLSLTLLHGAAAAGGLAYLIGTGKLATIRGDWVANYVFLAGGLAIIALCLIAWITQTRAANAVRG